MSIKIEFAVKHATKPSATKADSLYHVIYWFFFLDASAVASSNQKPYLSANYSPTKHSLEEPGVAEIDDALQGEVEENEPEEDSGRDPHS